MNTAEPPARVSKSSPLRFSTLAPAESERLARVLRNAIPWVLCGILALVFTAILLQHSLLFGKLAAIPMFDDISYFNDGYDRLYQWYEAGPEGVLAGYLAHPPHSPFSS